MPYSIQVFMLTRVDV